MGDVTGVFKGDEARELLRRVKRGELPDTLVMLTIIVNEDDPENRETYVLVADHDD